MPTRGNIYAYAREQAFREHGERLGGSTEGLVLVASTTPLSSQAQDALEKSFAALGMGEAACTFADISGLGPQDVFGIVEGIDPLVLVAADGTAANLYAQAVRKPFPPMRAVRVFGREARAFPNLNGMFASEADKQAVWRLLKSTR